jgi:uncharacterized protein Yka (UPF0111/DUF47 family)
MGLNLLDILLPRETRFFTYLNQQADALVRGASVFYELTTNIERFSEAEIKERLTKIKECEVEGDLIEVKIFEELNRTFITPIDREDIHTLTINIDRSLDILNSISRKVEIYQIRQVPANVCNFARLILDGAQQMRILVDHLERKEDIHSIANRMHVIENEADELFHVSMAELFKNADAPPVYVIKFKEFYEHLESVVDAIDYVGKLVRGIKVKQA